MSFEKAKRIAQILQDNGFKAVFAGGAVRDMVLGVEPHDFDVATSARPEDVKRIFINSSFVGESFGVSLVEGIEVASFRIDKSQVDGRKPNSIEFASMEEDSKRRDLTINALFWDPISEEFFDFVGGMKDIEEKIIRFVGDPIKRIEEDNLRIMRAIRFAHKLNFTLSKSTTLAIVNNAEKVKSLSGDRILEELKKGIVLDKPSKFISLLFSLGILRHILPEITDLSGCEQHIKWHPEGATAQKIICD